MTPFLRTAAAIAMTLAISASPLHAQEEEPVALIADRIIFTGEDTLIAEGDVQVFSEGRALNATRLTYNDTTGALIIDGPITLRDADGTVLLADAGELDTELETGILNTARVLVNERLQITGAQMERREGGFNDFRRVVATSCEICKPGQKPLWEVRARRVVQDENSQRIYFYDANFRVSGVPVFYLPVLRVPDPAVDRMTGFLLPSFSVSSLLGNGIRIPYFITLGQSADVTLTPYITDEDARTLELRYRQAFRRGNLIAEGAISQDNVMPEETRGYLFANARIRVPLGFTLLADYERTSDRTYLRDYDYSTKDILDSGFRLFRVQDEQLIDFSFTNFESLREADIGNAYSQLVEFDYRHSWEPAGIGGLLAFSFVAQARPRDDSPDEDNPNVDQIRGSFDWERTWTVASGFRFSTEAEANFDYRRITDDDIFPENQTAFTPTLATELSWPLAAQGKHAGVRYLLEPVAQLVWTRPDTLEGPNEDSTAISLDTGNLFALNRFPGLDRYETGLRSNLALRWARLAPSGNELGLTLGRVVRFGDTFDAEDSAILDGDASDWLAQIDVDFANRLNLRNLLLVNESGTPSINEARASWGSQGVTLSAAYVWQDADTSALLDSDLSELAFLGGFNITRTISTSFDLRHDFILDRTNRVDVGLAYENECIRVDLTAQRRFTSNAGDETETTYGLQVQLAGFGSEIGRNRARRKCTTRGRLG
ncbi:MAG: LPS assembly protein LptD [Pseudomonadota bacterium]